MTTYAELLKAISEREQAGLKTAKAYMTSEDCDELRASITPYGGEDYGPYAPSTGYFGDIAAVEIIQVAPGEAFYE